jgi:hypothetical protein
VARPSAPEARRPHDRRSPRRVAPGQATARLPHRSAGASGRAAPRPLRLALVDKEIANTLGELERKLRELERVLGGTSEGDGRPNDERRRADSAPAPAAASAEPAAPSRLIDEAVDREPLATATAAEQGAGWARDARVHPEAVADAGPVAYGGSREGGRRATDPARAADTAPGAHPAWAADAAPAADPAWAADATAAADPAAAAPAAVAGHAPVEQERSRKSARRPPPIADQTPSAAELLRFRERLERTARELTHDYDELLGRITYATVPTPTGPTISFARGAP